MWERQCADWQGNEADWLLGLPLSGAFAQLLKGIGSILEFLGHGNCSHKPKMLIWKDKGNLISELNMLGMYTLNRIRKQTNKQKPSSGKDFIYLSHRKHFSEMCASIWCWHLVFTLTWRAQWLSHHRQNHLCYVNPYFYLRFHLSLGQMDHLILTLYLASGQFNAQGIIFYDFRGHLLFCQPGQPFTPFLVISPWFFLRHHPFRMVGWGWPHPLVQTWTGKAALANQNTASPFP